MLTYKKFFKVTRNKFSFKTYKTLIRLNNVRERQVKATLSCHLLFSIVGVCGWYTWLESWLMNRPLYISGGSHKD